MNWKTFLKPTLGKILLTMFFLMVPVPFPREIAELFSASYSPIIFIPFLKTTSSIAYIIITLIAICFYILASLISNLYHRFVMENSKVR